MQHLFLRKVSHLRVSPVVKAYIIADTTLWSAWSLIFPIFAIFVVTKIDGGNIEIAATGYSLYLLMRVVSELFSAKFLINKNDTTKFQLTITGILCMASGYIGFAFSHTIFEMFIFYGMLGVGLGLATPAKGSLLATHLDKHREATELGVTDAIGFICMAIGTMMGGIIAHWFGFTTLFLVIATLTLLATVPYLPFISRGNT